MIASITFIHHSRSTIHQILPPKKSMSPRRKALLKSLLVLVLLLCFGLQVWDALSKFVGRRTTLVSTTERLEEAELPVVSFCPGYKDDVHYYDNLEELQRVLNQSTSEEREGRSTRNINIYLTSFALYKGFFLFPQILILRQMFWRNGRKQLMIFMRWCRSSRGWASIGRKYQKQG